MLQVVLRLLGGLLLRPDGVIVKPLKDDDDLEDIWVLRGVHNLSCIARTPDNRLDDRVPAFKVDVVWIMSIEQQIFKDEAGRLLTTRLQLSMAGV